MRKRAKVGIWSTVMLALCLSCAAGESEFARIDIDAAAARIPLTIIEHKPGGSVTHQTWGDAATRNQRIVAHYPVADSWKQAWVTFKGAKDGDVSVVLRGPYEKKGDGSLEELKVLYDCVSAEGAVIKDGSFEEGGCWRMADDAVVKNQFVSLSGRACATLWHDSPATQTISIKKDQPVTIRFHFRSPPATTAAPADFSFLNISTSVNMGFKDDVADDGKGGWSDQGPENDFASFDINRNVFANMQFRILDPVANNGKSVMTFASEKMSAGVALKSAEIDASGAKGCYLYLLHTACWLTGGAGLPIGKIEVTTGDGQVAAFDVLNQRDVADWWRPKSLENATVGYATDNPKSPVGVYVSKFKVADAATEVKSVKLTTTGSAVWIVLAATVSHEAVTPPRDERIVISESAAWRKVDMSSIQVRKGSALDLERFVEEGPSGKFGRVVVGDGGHLVFENRPDKRLLFLGHAVGGEHIFTTKLNTGEGLADKKSIELYADNIRRQGYNIFRPHFLDHALASDAKSDLDFNLEALDKFDYLVYCLKQRGVYIFFDCMTSWSGFKKGSGWSDAAKRMDLKGKMYLNDDGAREHWRQGVEKLMTHVNPYTKTTLAEDPIVACALFYNEQELCFASGLSDKFQKAWQNYLAKKYTDIEGLRKGWSGSTDPRRLTDVNGFGDLRVQDGDFNGATALAADLSSFYAELQTETVEWYLASLREIGYKGLFCAPYDCSKQLRYLKPRNLCPVMAMHSYHAHPSSYINPNSAISQKSSLKDVVKYFVDMAGTRFGNRPFLITEYKHCFWNKYRYEEGPVIGAYSAFQDYDLILSHANEVALQAGGPMNPFNVATDPLSRASQVISAFMFARRDVSPSSHYVEIEVTPQDVFNPQNAFGGIGSEQTRIALLTGLGVSYTGNKPPECLTARKADLTIGLGDTAKVRTDTAQSSTVDGGTDKKFQLASFITELKARKLLQADNVSDPEKGIFQSDTQQILLDSDNKSMRVTTPRCESVSSEAGVRTELSAMIVESSSVRSNVTLISLDNAALAASSRLLLVYSTAALNSGMTLSEDESVLLDNGKAPPLMMAGRLKIVLDNKNHAALKVWALGMDGTRKEELKGNVEAGKLVLTLDTATLANGATPFFELAVE